MDANHVLTELDVLRPKWTWLLFTGIIMVILGTTAVFIVRASTLGIAVFTGWILAFIGMIEMVHAFRLRHWAGFYLHLIGSVLGILIGLIVTTNPVRCAVADFSPRVRSMFVRKTSCSLESA